MVQQILVVIIEFKNVESLTVLFTITLFYFYRKTKLKLAISFQSHSANKPSVKSQLTFKKIRANVVIKKS